MTNPRLLLALALLAASFVDLYPAKAASPNIVFILADDLGYGDVGCYGATKVKTPNMDRLAREGRRFTDAHSASSVCTPSRYSLLTGEYAWRINNWAPIFCKAGLIVDPAKTTVASLLKKQGYVTACFGKWHLGFGDKIPDWNGDLKPGPLELGFDYYFGIPVVSSHSPYVYVENHRVLGLDPADPLVFGGVPPTQPFPEKKMDSQPMSGGKAAHALYQDEELGTTLAQKAVDWLRGHQAEPFFLYFATPQIHHPFTPHPRFKGTSQCGLYGDFVHELDWMIGQALGTLDELKLADKTLVIFTSDNGGMLNDGGKAAWQAGHRLNANLLGFKFGAWEGGHRVPFIARWPGHIAPGSLSDQLIANVDMLATVAAILGQPLRAKDGPDSFNVLPALTGNPTKPIRDHLVMAPNMPKNVAIRKGRWVYIGDQGSGGFGNGLKELAFTREVNSDITSEGRIRPEAPPAQLYDLESDPAQAVNVVRQHPDVVQNLKALLEKIQKDGCSAPARMKTPYAGGAQGPAEMEKQASAFPAYQTQTIQGWTVHISDELLQQESGATSNALDLLKTQLEGIIRAVPKAAVAQLQKVPLWISPEYPGVKPRAEYHPNIGWLREHGRNPAMAKSVEITNVRIFEQETSRMPVFILHELAHAYHDQVLGFDNYEIEAAYQRALEGKSYDAVERWNGSGRPDTRERAYAMTNAKEYFAETTEAFFGRNDFYPFTRAELEQHDPGMYRLLQRLWLEKY